MIVMRTLPDLPNHPWTIIQFRGVEIAINGNQPPMAFDVDCQLWKEIRPYSPTVLVYDKGYFFNA